MLKELLFKYLKEELQDQISIYKDSKSYTNLNVSLKDKDISYIIKSFNNQLKENYQLSDLALDENKAIYFITALRTDRIHKAVFNVHLQLLSKIHCFLLQTVI